MQAAHSESHSASHADIETTRWVVAEYAERVLLMHEGRLVFDGAFAAFVADPALRRAAAFEPPPATMLGLAFGRATRTVDELVRALDLPAAPA